MYGIIDYLKEFGGYTFGEQPFNEVDALILAQFSYFKWEHVIPGIAGNAEAISLHEMEGKMYEAEVFSYELYAEDNKRLWEVLKNSRRFGSMKCNYMSEILSESMQTQFCAFTVFLDDVYPIVLFRGTDETILGWKEDYDMAKDLPVAGQRIAAMYLRQVALRLDGKFITVGHSKGGNLAVYSVLDNNTNLQDRTDIIYNFDGPFFRDDILEGLNYDRIAGKVRKFIPQSSVVGILLEKEHNYQVIYSDAMSGVTQHSPFTWVVEKDKFVYRDEVHASSRKLNEKMISLVGSLQNDQIETIGNVLFGLFQAADITTTSELLKDKKKKASEMLKGVKNMSPEIKEQLKELIFDVKQD